MAAAVGMVAVAALRSRVWLADLEAKDRDEDQDEADITDPGSEHHERQRKQNLRVAGPIQLSADSQFPEAAMSLRRRSAARKPLENNLTVQRWLHPSAEETDAAATLQQHIESAAAHFRHRVLHLQSQLAEREKEIKLAHGRIDSTELKLAEQEACADHRAALLAVHQQKLRTQSLEIKQLLADKEVQTAREARSARKAARLQVLLRNVNTQVKVKPQSVISGQVVANELAEEGRRLKNALLTAKKKTPAKGRWRTALPPRSPLTVKVAMETKPVDRALSLDFLSDSSSPPSNAEIRGFEPSTPPAAAGLTTPQKHAKGSFSGA